MARSLRECLQERELTAELVWATTTEHLESPLVLIDAALLASADLCLLAFRGPVAEGLAQELLRKKKLVIDLADVEPKAPFLWPTLAQDDARQLGGYRRLPVGMALPLVDLLLALQPFSPEHATITTLESAAIADQPGLDELSEQVRAVFTMQDPTPKTFGVSLAFDVLPYGHEDGLKEAIWDGLRRAGARPTALALTRLLVPTFSADAAVVELILGAPPGKEALEEALSDAPGPDVRRRGRVRPGGPGARRYLGGQTVGGGAAGAGVFGLRSAAAGQRDPSGLGAGALDRSGGAGRTICQRGRRRCVSLTNLGPASRFPAHLSPWYALCCRCPRPCVFG